MRSTAWATGITLSASLALWSSVSSAAGPPTMVHTKDGSVYYGELVERVYDDHITIVLATNVIRRFAWKDIDPTPLASSPYVPPVMPAPIDTVWTKNGSSFHGEIIARVVGEHVTIKLETGELKTLEWADIDLGPPPPPLRIQPHAEPPIDTIHTKNGSIYHGEIIEKVTRDHVTLKLSTGDVKTIEWDDMAEAPPPVLRVPPPPRPMPPVALAFEASKASAILQRRQGAFGPWEDLCVGGCRKTLPTSGVYRVVGNGLTPTSTFYLTSGPSQVAADMGSKPRLVLGSVLAISSIAPTIGGLALAVAASTANTYTTTTTSPFKYVPVDNTGLDVAAIAVSVAAGVMLVAGVVLIATSVSSVRIHHVDVDGVHF